jgi:predicted membrane metal-binding protein
MNPPVNADALAGLRGYHYPDPVSWWPPAPGWWLLAALLLVLAGAVTLALLRRQRRRAALRAALRELDSLGGGVTDRSPSELARQLSRLLRRYALTRFPRHEVAGLTGDDWLRFLDAHGGDSTFTRGIGRQLQDAPYRAGGDSAATAELVALVRGWIMRNAGRRQ